MSTKTETKSSATIKHSDQAGTLGYNEVPYVSHPFDFTRPENLRTVAKLFGHEAPSLEKSRVLEIGGSDGMNLIRFAIDYPDSYNLGIDISEVEVRHGQERIKAIGLKNYDLKCISITDLDESHGKFDYIICHGVYSWVPDFVRESILKVTKKLLSKDGLAFISYNVKPGWNMINSIRELMLYHSSNFTETTDKIAQARLALDFISDSVSGIETPYAKLVSIFAKDLKDKSDTYLRHEYLAEENQAFYFHEFIEDARSHGLEYMGDTDVQRMYTGNLPVETAKRLSEVQNIIRTEQYIDFIRNTQFRCTILCHNDVAISRNITNDIFHSFYYSAAFVTDKEISEENILSPDVSIQFQTFHNRDLSITTSSPEVKAMLVIMMQHVGNPIKLDEIIKGITKQYKQLKKEKIIAEIDSVIGRILFSGYVKFFYTKPKSVTTISDKPKVSIANIHNIQQIALSEKVWVVNQTNQMLSLEDHYRHFIPLLDGTRSIEDLNESIKKLIEDKVLLLQIDNKTVEDTKLIEQASKQFVQNALKLLSNNHILVA